MNNNKLTTDDALELLVGLIRRLFEGRIPQMRETSVKRRFEKGLFIILAELAQDPTADIDKSPAWLQRLVYEMLTQYVMLYSLQPGQHLGVNMVPGMTDEDKISAILSEDIMPNSWPYPQSVPL